MQVVENWANVRGTIVSIAPHPSSENHIRAVFQIESVTPEGSHPNLLKEAVGQTIDVDIPAQVAAQLDLKPGVAIESRIQKTGPTTHFAAGDSIRVLR